MKREAKFTVLFRHWLMSNPDKFSAAYELKQTTTNSIAFNKIEEHQINALVAAKWGKDGLLYKAPDDSRAIKPFDLFNLYQSFAFIVIKYPKFFCLIDIDVFVGEKANSVRKSLTSGRAKEIASKVIALK